MYNWYLAGIYWENGGHKIVFQKNIDEENSKKITLCTDSHGISFPTEPTERELFADMSVEEFSHVFKILYQFINCRQICQ
jgi:hypothetical protein